MIIDFTVSNYRSIRDSATLSFVAQEGRASQEDSKDDLICPGYEIEGRDLKLLPVATVYGANASGKSNVIRALDALIRCMAFGTHQGRRLFQSFPTFRLDKDSRNAPTSFEANFAFDSNIFSFYLAVQGGVILEERLEYSPRPIKRQSTRLLYRRIYNTGTGEHEVEVGTHFNGPHVQLLNTVEKNDVFIALARRLQIPMLSSLTRWLSLTGMGIFCGTEAVDSQLSAEWFNDYEDDKEVVARLLRCFDTGIADFEVEKNDGDGEDKSYRLLAIHETPDNERMQWSFDDESLGTQRLVSILHNIFDALRWGPLLIVDEFGANFHPEITRTLIRLFQNPKTNPRGGQLLFTSHDNTLWRGILRRDQIWLTEKNPDQSTQLTPLSDYKPRTDLALDKAYLDGRFGGVPIVGEIEEVVEQALTRTNRV